jgi:hypothetical protein
VPSLLPATPPYDGIPNFKTASLYLSAPITISGSLYLSAPITISGSLYQSAPITISGSLYLSAPITISASLYQSAPITPSSPFAGSVHFPATVSFTGGQNASSGGSGGLWAGVACGILAVAAAIAAVVWALSRRKHEDVTEQSDSDSGHRSLEFAPDTFLGDATLVTYSDVTTYEGTGATPGTGMDLFTPRTNFSEDDSL